MRHVRGAAPLRGNLRLSRPHVHVRTSNPRREVCESISAKCKKAPPVRRGFAFGGERGIRTPEARFRRLHTFQACSFNHSDTSPDFRRKRKETGERNSLQDAALAGNALMQRGEFCQNGNSRKNTAGCMSYLVLARKWRPKKFAELVGQTHVVKALTNALETGRVHHAYLFTGTRGVGKTTIARIFAKSLNCEQGTGSEPCGVCSTCVDIDAGRYFDLIEIDAASNTGVDDVRDMIESAQYVPSRGKYKVYLIDEVHMLSKPAFNALLKTLEEPPPHVKFLLATTDPEKLLVTVLSRCLQFNLMRLDEEQIAGQIEFILGEEKIDADPRAIQLIAKAADGSMRDGLSLLDQAIAFSGSNLSTEQVEQMLGTVDRTRVAQLIQALSHNDGAALMQEVQELAEFSPDWPQVLDALNEAFHQVQLAQLVPNANANVDGLDVQDIAARVRPELVQLWYQMALNGRRDIGFAPSPRAGFEMVMLRMLAFKPGTPSATSVEKPAAQSTTPPAPTPTPVAAPVAAPAPAAPTPPTPPVATAAEEPPVELAPLESAADWAKVVKIMPANGATRHFAEMLHWVKRANLALHFELEKVNALLHDAKSEAALLNGLKAMGYHGYQIIVTQQDEVAEINSVASQDEKQAIARQQKAEQDFLDDPSVKQLLNEPDTRVVPGSIKPH